MMVIGIDAHKRSHTAVTVDEMGRQGFVKTVGTTTQDHLRLLKWAVGLAEERLWAIEDCRHLTRRLERDLIAAGESVVRVSPKLMAHVRDSARSYGKSDPIDALAVARAALRESNLPTARLDGIERELRLLVDHREAQPWPSVPASSPGCGGICTSWTPVGQHRQSCSEATHLTRFRCTCAAITTAAPWSVDWRCDWWSTCGC
jgi:Transposase